MNIKVFKFLFNQFFQYEKYIFQADCFVTFIKFVNDIVENKIATTKNQKVKGVCVNILKALKAKQNAGN